MGDIKQAWIRESEKFKNEGGDIRLFWAGRMSTAIGNMKFISIFNLSDEFKMLKWFSEQYDEIIFSEVNNKWGAEQ